MAARFLKPGLIGPLPPFVRMFQPPHCDVRQFRDARRFWDVPLFSVVRQFRDARLFVATVRGITTGRFPQAAFNDRKPMSGRKLEDLAGDILRGRVAID